MSRTPIGRTARLLLRRAARPAGSLALSAAACAGLLAATATWVASPAAATTPAPAAKAPQPPKPPYAYTGYASPVTATTATVRARIGPHGAATQYHFEYGTTTAYGAQTPPASAGSATTTSLLSQAIAGLTPNTTYHYRVVAINSAGTVTGHDEAFTTKKVPLALTLTASPDPAVFGSPVAISGSLSGTGAAGTQIVLQGDAFPYAHGFHDLTSPTTASASGAFSFSLAGLLNATQLRAVIATKPWIRSPVVTEPVAVAVTLHVHRTRRRGFVRLSGTITPAAGGEHVAFERSNREHRYVTVSGTIARPAGGGVARFARTVRLRKHGLYRAFVQISEGAHVSGRSRSILIR